MNPEILPLLTAPTWLLILGIFGLLLAGVKVAARGQFRQDALGLHQAKCIQGACAVMIIFHHSSQEFINNQTGTAGALGLFYNAGVLLVGVFFFFSGYGLVKSMLTKLDYLKGFLRRRLPSVLIPFWVCTAVFLLAYSAAGVPQSMLDILLCFCGVYLANSHMWYIIELVLLYVLFWAVFRRMQSRRTALLTVTLVTAAFTLAGPCFGHGWHWFQGEWWYNTTMLFAIGMTVAMYEKEISAFLQKHFGVCIAVLTAAFLILYRFTSYALANWSYWSTLPAAYACLALQLPMVVCFILWMVTLLQKVKFENCVLRFLGSIGLEIYLLHNLFLMGLHDPAIVWVGNEFLYVLLIVAGAVLLAVPVHALDQAILRRISGRKPEKAAEKECAVQK
jgi:membrane-bound acyltransferase YfiQ involved in biofilm formation